MSLPIKKIYVNSRYKTADSVSDSNFKFEIPYALKLPSNAIFYVTYVCIPNLFKTIARGENDTLYFEAGSAILPLGFSLSGTVTIPPGNYTELAFTQVLSQLLNDQSIGSLHADYDSANNVCSIYTSSYDQKFRILTDEEVQKNIVIVVIR